MQNSTYYTVLHQLEIIAYLCLCTTANEYFTKRKQNIFLKI